jgi:putative membrane protein
MKRADARCHDPDPLSAQVASILPKHCSLGLNQMIAIIAHWFIAAAILLVVARFIPGIEIDGWGSALIGAVVLGLVNAFVRPLLIFFTLPITILTLGLFLLIINALMLSLVAGLVPGIRIAGFGSALVGSLLLTFLNLIVGAILRS